MAHQSKNSWKTTQQLQEQSRRLRDGFKKSRKVIAKADKTIQSVKPAKSLSHHGEASTPLHPTKL